MAIVVRKNDVLWLQKSGLLKDSLAVNEVWGKLNERCHKPTIKDVEEAENIHGNYLSEVQRAEERLPPLQHTFKRTLALNRMSIICSRQNGLVIARSIRALIKADMPLLEIDLLVSEDNVDFVDLERRLASSSCLVALLTAHALRQPEVIFALLCAKHYFLNLSQTILVHDAGSCFFPSPSEQPSPVFLKVQADRFSGYALEGVLEIMQKFRSEMQSIENARKIKQEAARSMFDDLTKRSTEQLSVSRLQKVLIEMDPTLQPDEVDPMVTRIDANQTGFLELSEFCDILAHEERLNTVLEKYQADKGQPSHENIETTVFLSHKRSTGQGIAGRLYEGLKAHYSIFLDSEAKFKIHDLKQIVLNTRVFVFILTSGIFQSQWCLEELKSAIENNKQVIIVRELSFQMPDIIPPAWQDYMRLLLERGKELIWMAEYNTACIEAMVKLIGPDDSDRASAEEFVTKKRERLVKSLQERKHLRVEGVCGVPLLLGTELERWQPKTAVFRRCRPSLVEMRHYLYTCEDISISDSYAAWHDLGLLRSGSLKTLSLINTGVTAKALLQIAFCKSLRHLTITPTLELTPEVFAAIAELTMLESLDLGASYYTSKSPGLDQIFQKCKSLKSIQLKDCQYVTDETVREMLQQLPELECIGLGQIFELTDESLLLIARHCSRIKELEVSSKFMELAKFTDIGFLTIAQHCKLLERLDVSCSLITDNALIQMAQNLPLLKNLNLGSTQKITDMGLEALGKHCTSMKTLNLSANNQGISQITELGLAHIAKGMPLLQELDLCNQSCTDSVIGLFVDHCKDLQALYIEATKVNDKGIELLSKAQHLTDLNLNYCKSITDKGILELARCISLQKLKCNTGFEIVSEQIAAKSILQLVKDLPSLSAVEYNCHFDPDAPNYEEHKEIKEILNARKNNTQEL